eukprot:scaffold4968_cov127-Cylindrotheca_fusiformis.AAC.1
MAGEVNHPTSHCTAIVAPTTSLAKDFCLRQVGDHWMSGSVMTFVSLMWDKVALMPVPCIHHCR